MEKKVLIFIQDLTFGGGAEKIAYQLTIGLSKTFNPSILTISKIKNSDNIKEYHSLDDSNSFSKKVLDLFKISTIIRPFKIYKKIKLISPDIIISFMEYTNFLMIITKIIFRLKIPLIIAVHCNPKFQYNQSFQYFNRLIKILYNSNVINKIITVSKGVEKSLCNDYHIKENKLETIYNGIDIEQIRSQMKESDFEDNKIFNNRDDIKFINIGRLSYEKGHKYLIEAFLRVKKSKLNSKLFILGDGPLKVDLMKLIKELNLEADVFLLGLKSNPFKYLAKSDIFVFSSLYEALPTVLLEALACNLPIISTNCKTGPKEILNNGEYGLLVKVCDPVDLAEKMENLAKNRDLMRFYSKKSTQRALDFSIDRFLDDWVNMINKILYS